MVLPISLTAAAVAALINIWLGWRVGQVRIAEKVLTGDGGNEKLICRMRAHANFVEYTPFVLILIVLLELATGTSWLLWAVMAIYMLARVGHAFGMDADYPSKLRQIGILVTMLTLLVLGGYAIYATRAASSPETERPVEQMPLDGPMTEVVPQG